MEASANFDGDAMLGGSEKGQVFTCPDCQTEVLIRNNGALFVGAVISAFWLAVGYWTYLKGPSWYYRHWEFVIDDPINITFFLMDMGVILLSVGTMALSAWVLWTFLLAPLRTRWRNPVVGETRELSTEEKSNVKLSRRRALLAFFVYPLAIWIPLLGLIYMFDMMDIDMRSNGVGKNALVFGLLAFIYYLARRIGIRAYYAFIGMIFWLAVIVAVIFIFG
jgi:hypothetical protein